MGIEWKEASPPPSSAREGAGTASGGLPGRRRLRCKPKTGRVRRRPSPFLERVAHARADTDRDACICGMGETEIKEDIFFVAPETPPRTLIPRGVHPREGAVLQWKLDDINIT